MGKRVFTDEFKKAAVDQVIVQRHTMKSVAKRLDVNYHTLREWVQAAKAAAGTSLIPTDLPTDQLVRELQKENARLRMERDILKKATAYFAKEHL
jgi:transposase